MPRWVFRVNKVGESRRITIPKEVVKLWNDPLYVIIEYDINRNELIIKPLT